MATTRMLRTSVGSSGSVFSSPARTKSVTVIRCLGAEGFVGEKRLSSGGGERRTAAAVVKAVAASESLATSKQETSVVDLASLLVAHLRATALRSLKVATKRRPWRMLVQMAIERVRMLAHLFRLLVFASRSRLPILRDACCGGNLARFSAVLCGDMFLVGTAMLIFGVGLHVMFVGSRNLSAEGSQLPGSNFFGLFHLKELPSWVGMKSITQAKSKIGHALMMILQVGVLEKFKSIPLVTGLDLACFAGAVFMSSACIFLLSKLSLGGSPANP
ncbi:hypothetical protein RJ640_020359 [Escallonia rubra]|uniref:Uncharacterized protein n=1 Tax=Escallonia rubra TaxID=112253 RepID=A0AA88QXX8_9ASTE|nr:hypothetical protein RJ640_020359 [Escallonia rubra]